MVVVGPAAAFQARRLESDGYPFPLLLDPDYRLGQALEVGKQSLSRYILNLRAWTRWLWALATHRKQGKITGHYSNLPGTAIVDADGEVLWVFRGSGLGDHPPVTRILLELDTST